jgi:hypothetical protein
MKKVRREQLKRLSRLMMTMRIIKRLIALALLLIPLPVQEIGKALGFIDR